MCFTVVLQFFLRFGYSICMWVWVVPGTWYVFHLTAVLCGRALWVGVGMLAGLSTIRGSVCGRVGELVVFYVGVNVSFVHVGSVNAFFVHVGSGPAMFHNCFLSAILPTPPWHTSAYHCCSYVYVCLSNFRVFANFSLRTSTFRKNTKYSGT